MITIKSRAGLFCFMNEITVELLSQYCPKTAAAFLKAGVASVSLSDLKDKAEYRNLVDVDLRASNVSFDTFMLAVQKKKPLNAHRAVRLDLGATYGEMKGDEIDVVLIVSGMTLNGDYIPKETLQRAAPLFENSPACAYEFSGIPGSASHFSHVRPDIREMVGSFLGNVIGFYSNVTFGPYQSSDGEERFALFAKLKVTAQWFKDFCISAFKSNVNDRLGLSADVEAWFSDIEIDNVRIPCMEEIIRVHEVTAVTHPAAGGRLLRIAASVKKSKGSYTMNDAIYQWLVENCSDLVPEIPDLNDDQKEAVILQALAKLKEKAEGPASTMYDTGNDEAAANGSQNDEAAADGEVSDAGEQVADASQNGKTTDVKKLNQNDAGAQRARKVLLDFSARFAGMKKQIDAMNADITRDKNARMVDAALGLSALPDQAKERVRKMFSARTSFTDTDLLAAMKDEQEYIASLVPSNMNVSGQNRQLDTVIKTEEYDRFVDAMTGMLLNKDQNAVPRFKSVHASYREITGFTGSPSEFADQMMREALYSLPPLGTKPAVWRSRLQASRRLSSRSQVAQFDTLTTTLWAEVYGDSNRRALMQFYNTPTYQDWRKIARVVPVPDFRTNRRQRIGGFDDLSVVSEGGTYTEQTWPADQEVAYAAQKRGNIQPLTWETFVNDDLNVLQNIPRILGTAAARTLYKFVFDFIRSNPTMDYDSVALFDATRGNLGSTALSDAALDDRIFAMKNQTELTSGERLGIVPKFILVPHNLSRQAWENAKASVSSLSGRTETVENWYKQFGLEPIEVFYWEDATDWALVADPADWPTCEIGFLGGQEEPEVFIQDQPLLGSVYTAEKISFKIRHIYGGDWLDHRSADKSVVAG